MNNYSPCIGTFDPYLSFILIYQVFKPYLLLFKYVKFCKPGLKWIKIIWWIKTRLNFTFALTSLIFSISWSIFISQNVMSQTRVLCQSVSFRVGPYAADCWCAVSLIIRTSLQTSFAWFCIDRLDLCRVSSDVSSISISHSTKRKLLNECSKKPILHKLKLQKYEVHACLKFKLCVDRLFYPIFTIFLFIRISVF